MQGVQYDLVTGIIEGTVSPPATSSMPDGKGQLILSDDTLVDPDTMKIDTTQDPPILIPSA